MVTAVAQVVTTTASAMMLLLAEVLAVTDPVTVATTIVRLAACKLHTVLAHSATATALVVAPVAKGDSSKRPAIPLPLRCAGEEGQPHLRSLVALGESLQP